MSKQWFEAGGKLHSTITNGNCVEYVPENSEYDHKYIELPPVSTENASNRRTSN